jgi:RNA polymerase sigma factor (TIGR02999 family)
MNSPSPPLPTPGEVTTILARIEDGDAAARDQLLTLVYDELRMIAGGLMRRERQEHTLQPTALVHEATLRLLNAQALDNMKGRGYFYAAVTRAMRQILVEHARRRTAQRRGGDRSTVPLDCVVDSVETEGRVNLLTLNDALEQLSALNGRQSEVVTMRFFGGMGMEEIADALGISLSSVEKDWRLARAWLRTQVGDTT